MHHAPESNSSPLAAAGTVPIELLRNFIAGLLREAKASVPVEFSARGLSQKYLNGDNHAGGLQEAAERLEALLAHPGIATFPKGVWQFGYTENGKAVYQGPFLAFERARQAAQKWARQHPEHHVCLTFHSFGRIAMEADDAAAAADIRRSA